MNRNTQNTLEPLRETYGLHPHYLWGFNGMERQDEIAGVGNNYDFGARIYDPRIGMWFSPDPLAIERSWVSPYNFVQNNPITRIDPTGALDTKYVDEVGDEIESTNDGNDDIVIVKDEDRKLFETALENTSEEYLRTPEWNSRWSGYLERNMENQQSAYGFTIGFTACASVGLHVSLSYVFNGNGDALLFTYGDAYGVDFGGEFSLDYYSSKTANLTMDRFGGDGITRGFGAGPSFEFSGDSYSGYPEDVFPYSYSTYSPGITMGVGGSQVNTKTRVLNINYYSPYFNPVTNPGQLRFEPKF